MKRAYEYFANKHTKIDNLDKKSININESHRATKETLLSKRDERISSIGGTSINTGANSLKNSKQSKNIQQLQPEKQQPIKAQQPQQQVSLPDPSINTKMTRVKSYGNIATKNQKHHPSKDIATLKANILGVAPLNLNPFKRGGQQLDNQQFYKQGQSDEPTITGASSFQISELDRIQTPHIQMPGSQVRDNSPKFLQINLKMFNNYMSNNNPTSIYDSENIINPNINMSDPNIGSNKAYQYQDQRASQKNLQSQNFSTYKTQSKERIGKARDPMSKLVQDETMTLMSQVSKKSLELYQLLEKDKGSISVDMISQYKNQDRMKILQNLQNYIPSNFQPPNAKAPINANSFSSASINTQAQTSNQTIQQSSSDKKRPQSEMSISSNFYMKCQQNIQKLKGAPLKRDQSEKEIPQVSQQFHNRLGSQSSCNLLQVGERSIAPSINYNNESKIMEEATPNQKNHIQILVSMLNEKNKYIKVLHHKVDKLNDMIQVFQVQKQAPFNSSSDSSPQYKSKNYKNIQRARSANDISKKPKVKRVQPQEGAPLVQSININFDKALNSLQQMKLNNMEILKELFLNEESDDNDFNEYGNVVDQSANENYSSADGDKNSIVIQASKNHYGSVGANDKSSYHEEESYQDYLNNADLEPIEDFSNINSNQKQADAKSNLAKKSQSISKIASVRTASQKNTARGNAQSSLQKQTPQLPLKGNISTYRPPTSQATQSKKQSKRIPNSNNNMKVKKSSLASVCDKQKPQSNFVSIMSNEKNPPANIIEQLNQCKLNMKTKDKKIEKHKEFIKQLKLSLQTLLNDHKKQSLELETQKKELRLLKCKLGI